MTRLLSVSSYSLTCLTLAGSTADELPRPDSSLAVTMSPSSVSSVQLERSEVGPVLGMSMLRIDSGKLHNNYENSRYNYE